MKRSKGKHKMENYDAINNVIITTYLLLQPYSMRTTSVSFLFSIAGWYSEETNQLAFDGCILYPCIFKKYFLFNELSTS